VNPLLSLFGRFLACGGRKRGNRQTDRQTNSAIDSKHSDTSLFGHL
jgi:hypothetical protein